MKDKNGQNKVLGLVLFLLFVFASYMRFDFIQISLSNYAANPDEILTFLQAREISSGGYSLFFWTQPYQFPFEAYLLSTVVEQLSWNTFGLRVMQLSLCALSVVFFLLFALKLSTLDKVWPAIVYILLPSAYWYIRQVGLMTPQHAASAVFVSILFLLYVLIEKRALRTPWCFVAGLIAGLALSNHLLLLSVVAPCMLGLSLSRSFLEAKKNSLYLIPGFLIGLMPYLYAKLFIPGAYQRVADTLPVLVAARRMFQTVLLDQIPIAFGINSWIFPDAGKRVSEHGFLAKPFMLLFVLILCTLTLIRAYKFILRLKKQGWPSIGINDVLIGSTWLALILVSMSAMPLRTRYLLPVLWAAPFIFSYTYAISSKFLKCIVASVVVALCILNFKTIDTQKDFWRSPSFSQEYANLPGLAPVYDYLSKHGARHCYAGWWLAYRIVFETKEQIICSPPFNDRFPGWPQPFYRSFVDESENTPFIEGGYEHRLLRGSRFVPYLLHHQIHAERLVVKPYTFYRNFRHRAVRNVRVLDSGEMFVKTSSKQEDAKNLLDENIESVWTSQTKQEKGMWVEVELATPTLVHTVRLLTRDRDYEKDPPRLNIEGRLVDGSWQTLVADSVGHPYPIKLTRDSIVRNFSGLELMLGFSPREVKALRISIEKPNLTRAWEIAEIDAFTGELLTK